MTEKHFIALADLIKDLPTTHRTSRFEGYAIRVVYWQDLVDAMADYLTTQNGQFNREWWLAYVAGECGPSGDQIKPKKQSMVQS